MVGQYECAEPSCKSKTRQLAVNQRCVNGACKGRLNSLFSEKATNDTIRYLKGLFDVDKFMQENPFKQDGKGDAILRSDIINS